MINLDNLVAIHENPESVRRHRRILNELFYLCINETFLTTVEETRRFIADLLEYQGDFPMERDVFFELVTEDFLSNESYLELLTSISYKHRYHHPSFTRNYRLRPSETSLIRFNILENILFFNDPIPEINPFDHFNNSSGHMEIVEDDSGPYIKLQFDIGTTAQEMHNIIEKQFDDILVTQADNYNISKQTYRFDKDRLSRYYTIYKEMRRGRSDIQMAVTLDKMGLLKEDSADGAVRKARERLDLNVSRFNADD